jgi:hypothetical protein
MQGFYRRSAVKRAAGASFFCRGIPFVWHSVTYFHEHLDIRTLRRYRRVVPPAFREALMVKAVGVNRAARRHRVMNQRL